LSSEDRKIPRRAVAISALALLVPVWTVAFAPEVVGDYELWLWLLALVPPFLLSYYRGWRGVAAALAAGMAVLSVLQVLVPVSRLPDSVSIPLIGLPAAYVVIALGVGWLSEALHREGERAARLALTDDLTGLPNRRYMRLFLETEFAAAQRGRVLTVALFDLDRFKQYNDRYGHLAGDEALRAVAGVLRMHTRRMNLSARYGGEEFVSILSAADVKGALTFVERVRKSLAEVEIEGGPLSVSVGVAMYDPGMQSVEDLLAAADHALYQAKRAGRNQVRVFGERVDTGEEPAPGASGAGGYVAASIGSAGVVRFGDRVSGQGAGRAAGGDRVREDGAWRQDGDPQHPGAERLAAAAGGEHRR